MKSIITLKTCLNSVMKTVWITPYIKGKVKFVERGRRQLTKLQYLGGLNCNFVVSLTSPQTEPFWRFLNALNLICLYINSLHASALNKKSTLFFGLMEMWTTPRRKQVAKKLFHFSLYVYLLSIINYSLDIEDIPSSA